MDPTLIGWLGIGLMLGLLALGAPIYGVLSVVGFAGYWLIAGQDSAMGIVGLVPYSRLAVYTFTVVPLFILMGNIVFAAGFGADVYDTSRKWFGRIPGGLAQATVAACAMFGAASGSTIATASTFTRISVPEMLRFGYSPRLALASVAAAGTISQMIPPSIIMVLYGLITEQSVSRLLIAGILPGVITAVNYMVMIYFWAKRHPEIAPMMSEKWNLREAIGATKGVLGVAIIGAIVMVGIYGGLFTPTEAGGTGAFAAFIVVVAARRFSFKRLGTSLRETAKTTVMIHAILLGAFIFSSFISITLIPQQISAFLSDLPVPPIVILLGIMAMYIVLGTVMDILSALFLTLPLIFPTVMALGYDPIWFGVLIVHLVGVAVVTPPFGINLFVIKAAMPEAEMGDIMRGVMPFLAVDMVTLGIYIAFPQVALFLPNQMLGA